MKKTIIIPLTRQFSIIICTFIVCTLSIILYRTYDYTKLQTNYMDDSLEFYSAQVNKSTNDLYDFYKNICYSVGYNQTVLNFLETNTENNDYELFLQIQNLISNTASLNPYIVDIAIDGKNNSFIALNGTTENYMNYKNEFYNSRFSFQSVGTSNIKGIPCHIMAIPIYSLGTGESSFLGLLFLAIDLDNLFHKSLNISNYENKYNPAILFTDSKNNLIYGDSKLYSNLPPLQEKEEIFQIKVDNINYSVVIYPVFSINHVLYILIDKTETTKQIFQISLHLILSMFIIIFVFFLLLLILYRPLISSLNQLTHFMRSVCSGNTRTYKNGFYVNQGVIGSSEIDEIFHSFNSMLDKINQLNHDIFDNYTRMYELEANNRKTEIALLRSQINPHFLYNTLTMICGIASVGEYEKIINVTNSLSQIFRYSIKGYDRVTLREELEIVSAYLMIQKERFDERFSVRYELEEGCLDYIIPKMVIQPLVENAIVHGIEKSLKPGKILIGAGHNKENNYLAIWVYDTGIGIPYEKLQELRHKIQNYTGEIIFHISDSTNNLFSNTSTVSIGLMNVNSRMVLYYGTNYSIILDSELGVGTNIQLRIPYTDIPDSINKDI